MDSFSPARTAKSPFWCGNIGLTRLYSPPNVLSDVRQTRVSQLKEDHGNINHLEA